MVRKSIVQTIEEVVTYLQTHQGKLPSAHDKNLKVRQLYQQFWRVKNRLRVMAAVEDIKTRPKRRKRAASVVRQRVTVKRLAGLSLAGVEQNGQHSPNQGTSPSDVLLQRAGDASGMDLPQDVVVMDLAEKLMPGWRKLIHSTHKPMLLGSGGAYMFCMPCGPYASHMKTFKGPRCRLAVQCYGTPATSDPYAYRLRRLMEGKNPISSQVVDGGVVRAIPHDWSENVGGNVRGNG